MRVIRRSNVFNRPINESYEVNEAKGGNNTLDQEIENDLAQMDREHTGAITDILDDCLRVAKQNNTKQLNRIEVIVDKALEGFEDKDSEEAQQAVNKALKEYQDSLKKGTKVFSNNVLFEGPTGSGKTSIIKQWAKKNGVDVVAINTATDVMDFLGIKGVNHEGSAPSVEYSRDKDGKIQKGVVNTPAKRVTTIGTSAFDKLRVKGEGEKPCILFLDEINTVPEEILRYMYDLISFHLHMDGDEIVYLDNLLFTVGAMNPADYGSRNTLDSALYNRFAKHIKVNYDTKGLREHLLEIYNEDAEDSKHYVDKIAKKPAESVSESEKQRAEASAEIYEQALKKIDLVKTLLADGVKMMWSTKTNDSENRILVPRTLCLAIDNCDGSKESFLKEAAYSCGTDNADGLENLLNAANYKDTPHKLNLEFGYVDGKKEAEESKNSEVSADDLGLDDKNEPQKKSPAEIMKDKMAQLRKGLKK